MQNLKMILLGAVGALVMAFVLALVLLGLPEIERLLFSSEPPKPAPTTAQPPVPLLPKIEVIKIDVPLGHEYECEELEFIRVIDPATVLVRRGDGEEGRVRLLCIQTPKAGEAGYDEAVKGLTALIGKSKVLGLETEDGLPERDAAGNLQGYLRFGPEFNEDGESEMQEDVILNVEMIRLGYAQYDEKKEPSRTYAKEFNRAAKGIPDVGIPTVSFEEFQAAIEASNRKLEAIKKEPGTAKEKLEKLRTMNEELFQRLDASSGNAPSK